MQLLFPAVIFAQKENDNTYRESIIRQFCNVCRHAESARSQTLSRTWGYVPQYMPFARDIDLHNAHVLMARKETDSAYRFTLNAIRMYQTLQDDSLLYFARMLNALILNERQLPAQALREYTAVMKIGARLRMPLLTAVYADMGLSNYQLGHLDSAYYWYHTAEQQRDFSSSLTLQRNVFNNLGIYYLYEEQYTLAEHYHRKSLAIRKYLQDTTGVAESYLNLGDLYFDQYQNRRAARYWRKSLKLARQLKDLPLLELANYNLSEAAEANHRYKAALHYYRSSVCWKDSLWNRDKVWTLAETQKQLAVKENQSRILTLERDVALQQQETIIKKRQRNTLLAGCLVLAVVVCMSIILYRQKIKSTRILLIQHRQLDQLNQVKDRLFSIIAHDMRAPLTVLYHKSSLLAGHVCIQEHAALSPIAADMQRGITAVHTLLDNLLYWSFSETGNLLLHIRPLPVQSLVEQAAAHLALQLQHKQIRVCYQAQQDAFVLGDAYTLKIIFRNLIQNAIKFSFPGQAIDITIYRDAAHCGITIRDRGTGIPEELFPCLFSFNREKQRTGTHGESGSGLGLWLCHDFVQKNKGILRLSNHPDGGAVATVLLPFYS